MKKKPTKKSTVRRRAPSSRESIAALKKTIALQAQQIREGAEQQAATSDILRMIARTSGNLKSVMDAIAENAARLCDANDALVWRVNKKGRQLVSHFGASPTMDRLGEWHPVERGTPTGRAIIDRKTIHVHDLLAARAEFPAAESRGIAIGIRSTVATPLLRDQVPIGVIHIRRMEVRPFTAAQLKLLETFADQAVIAIENVRLFNELENRNRQLTESLEQQTATGEVLRVIASSPTELQPVLDTLIANAVKLSGATKGHIRQVDGEFYRVVVHYGETPERIRFLRDNPLPATADSSTNRAFVARKPIHITDVQLEPEPLASFVRQTGVRTLLATPLIREETPIGVIIIWREVVEPFTERQIELVKTFADQAVIAIENVRLFKQLEE